MNATLLAPAKTVTMPVAEHLYDALLHRTKFVNYGVDFDDLVQGKVAPPPAGARFDIHFAGTVQGPKLQGTLQGIDFLVVRADGRCDLDMHSTIVTDDGASIAFYADGIFVPPADASGIAQVRENVRLTTADPRYEWVNTLQVWVTGVIDVIQEEIRLHAYVA